MTTFIGSNSSDVIVPGQVSPGTIVVGPDASPDAGDDLIASRAGDDTVAGGGGDDVAVLGTGDDVFGWAPGDGSDTVFGQAGFDGLGFDGNDADEVFALFQAGGETRFDRDLGAIAMRMTGVERVALFAGGGADVMRLGTTMGSAVEEFAIDLAAAKGARTGDGAADRIEVAGDAEDSFVSILGSGDTAAILGLPVFVAVAGAEAGDTIAYAAGGGRDNLSVSRDMAMRLQVDAGAGDDFIASGAGDDLLRGGSGADFVIGGRGDDTALLGGGGDIFQWEDGDGSDLVDGGGGRDAHLFNGGSAAEAFRLEAAGSHALLTRDLGDIRMDLTRIEAVTIRAFGGSDAVSVGDLTGTAIDSVEVALSLPGRAGDDAADSITLEGGTRGEEIDVASGGGSLVTVDGLRASVDVFGVEAIDTLTIRGGGGVDDLSAIDLQPGQVRLVLDGGAGGDFLFGSGGADLILGGEGDDRIAAGAGDDDVFGGRGDDIAVLGEGDDRFSWDPADGNDAVVGGEGTDSLDFEGAGLDEVLTIRGNATEAVLLADALLPGGGVASARIDMDEVERIELHVLGGTDEVIVQDLADTDLDDVVIDLGGPDGAADLVTVEGTEGADNVTIRVEGDAVVVSGLAATVRIIGFDGLDQFQFRGLGGEDTVDASDLAGIDLFVQGGDGDDLILGSGFADRLSGDAGDDVILAAGGDDAVFGGTGDDVLDGGAGFDALYGGTGTDVLLNGEVTGDDPLLV